MPRKTTGRIYRRGKSKNYLAEYYLDGQRFRQLLRDADGNPVEDKDAARGILDDLLNPVKLNDKAERSRQLVAAVASIEQKVEKAEDIANPPLTIADAWAVYAANLDRPDSGERTLANYAGHWSQFKTWLAANHPQIRYLRDVTPQVAKLYAASLNTAGVSPNTYNKHVRFLELLFRILEKEARTEANPFASIARKKLKTNSRRALTVEELFRIIDTAEGDMQLLMELGIYTGLRLGDCATLEWSNIDMERKIILRVPNKTASRKNIPVKIGLPSILHLKLAGTPPQARKGYLLPEMAKAYLNPISRCGLSRRIQAHFADCGIQTQKTGTGEGTEKRAVVDAGFHSLRHSYVELQSQIGTSQLVISKQVGHANPQMTRAYGDVSEAAALNAAAGMARLLGQGAADSDSAERQRLAGLAMTADIERVERALAILE